MGRTSDLPTHGRRLGRCLQCAHPADEKKLFTRQVEVFAGFTEQTDHEIGRLVDAIAEMDELDNTLFLYIAGDNGTSAEGGMVGMFNEMTYFNGVQETVQDQLKNIDKWGGPETFPHMAAGWAVAFDTPFMWTKQVASNYGGTRVGSYLLSPHEGLGQTAKDNDHAAEGDGYCPQEHSTRTQAEGY